MKLVTGGVWFYLKLYFGLSVFTYFSFVLVAFIMLTLFSFISDFFMKKNMIAAIAPRVSASMSFCASHMSPCEPRNTAPASGAANAAKIHSIISYPAAIVTIVKIGKSVRIVFDFTRSFLCRISVIGYAKKPTVKWAILSRWFLWKSNRFVTMSNGTFANV